MMKSSKMKALVALLSAALFACLALTGCDMKPPQLSGLDDTVEVLCGTDFNAIDYVNDHLEISDETDDGVVDYKLKDLQYTITCDGDIYDPETGVVDTVSDYGDFTFLVAVKDEANNEAKTQFVLRLNPLDVQQDFYVYKQSSSNSFDVMGFCSFENKSKVALKINKIEFQYMDKDDVTVCGNDMVRYAPEYLNGLKIGFAQDTYGGTKTVINSEDDITAIKVNVDYERAVMEDTNTLGVGDVTKITNYPYDMSHFAGEAIVTNPFSKTADYYTLLVGMYTADNKLIGVLNSTSITPIGPDSKAKVTASWLPASSSRPDMTDHMVGAACVNKFGD